MSVSYPQLDVAAVLIGRAGSLLLDYNDRWQAFAFPTSKVHEKPPVTLNAAATSETPLDAAVRAAVEVLGVPLAPERLPQLLGARVPPWNQSGRDGQWKRYAFHLFGMKIDFEPRPLPGHTAVWISPSDLQTHQPLSPTIALILNAVEPSVLAKLLA